MKITFGGLEDIPYKAGSFINGEPLKKGTYNKIQAIKAVRQYNTMGLKECKEAIEHAIEQGYVIVPDGEGSVVTLRQQLKSAGPFDAKSTHAELHDAIEYAIGLAVGLRRYSAATTLIALLPEEIRTE